MKIALASYTVLSVFWLVLFTLAGIALAADNSIAGGQRMEFNTVTLAVITGLFTLIAILLRMHHNIVMDRITKAEQSNSNLRTDLEKRLTGCNADILTAMKELAANSVKIPECNQQQVLINQKWENFMTVQALRATMDEEEHQRIHKTLDGMLGHLDSISNCLIALQHNEVCEPNK